MLFTVFTAGILASGLALDIFPVFGKQMVEKISKRLGIKPLLRL